MSEFFLSECHFIELPEAPSKEELSPLQEGLSRQARRRISTLGLMLSQMLQDVQLSRETVLIYVSTYADTCALESYLDSFPTPSPTYFQTSIHPSGVEQALIFSKQPVDEFYPFAGMDFSVPQAFRLAASLSRSGKEVVMCGGEERGTWLLDAKCASSRNYAYALKLIDCEQDALARITLGRPGVGSDLLTNESFLEILQQRLPMSFSHSDIGQICLDWL
jgi:hypothetical protein